MASKKSKIRAIAIVEIAGKPKKYVEDTMKLVLDRLKEEEGMKVAKSKVHDAKDHEGIFSTFSEIEIEFEGYEPLLLFCFEYMPSSIEFLEPEEIKMESQNMTNIFNDLLARLHQADSKVKDVNAANIILEKNANNLLKIAISLSLKEGEKPIDYLSKCVGIVPEQLKPFLERYIGEKVIKKDGDNYCLQNATI